MVFLLHGEDSFRTRLRVGELVASLLAGGMGEPGDLSQRESPPIGGNADAGTTCPSLVLQLQVLGSRTR